jgi:sorbitol-specific phosphotransferase system component IIA
MDKESLKARITEIGTCEDEAQRRELLTALGEDVSKELEEYSVVKKSNEDLTKDNEDLRSANMKLFLRLGEHKTPEEIAKSKGEETPEEKKDFKDLFDEKGNIK